MTSIQPMWLRKEDIPPLPAGWRAIRTTEATTQLKPGKLFERKTCADAGLVPVLNQGEAGFIGFHDEEPGVIASVDCPVVTFANHTCAMRLLKHPFSCIQNIFPKVGKQDVCDTVYFYYAAQGRVSLADYKGHHPLFRQMYIPLPPIHIQRKIAAILLAYDDLIGNNLRRFAILEEIVHNVYREWFVHLRFPGHEHTRRIRSQIGEIPEGWQVAPLLRFAEMTVGGDWGSDQPTDVGSVQVACLRGVDLAALWASGDTEPRLRWVNMASLLKRRITPDDVVVESSGECGRSMHGFEGLESLTGHPTVYSNFCRRLRCQDASISRYIARVLNEMVSTGEMQLFRTGTAIPNLNVKALTETHQLLWPPESLLRSFDDLVQPAEMFRLLGLNRNLRMARDLLLPKLISGEVDVSELDIRIREEGDT